MLALLYHRIGEGKYANNPGFMARHLKWISDHYQTVLPGETLHRRSICLTFDDATYDFYHYAFPLLKKLKMRALLAVPAHFIQEETDLPPELRLSVPYSMTMKGDFHRTHVPFCTWRELREMTKSGYVCIASHGVHHKHLLSDGIDLDYEIIGSKKILEEKLSLEVHTFVYPLGKFNRQIHSQVKKHYEFAMRIGAAWNTSWQNRSGLIYRIQSDNLTSVKEPFRMRRKFSYSWFYLINTLRSR